MEFYNILSTWSGAITSVFEKHPAISAIFTIFAIFVFFYLEKKRKKTLKNLFMVLIGWLILVPIIGSIADLIIWLISFASNILDLISATYKKFEAQPFWVLGYLFLSIIFYLLFPKIQKNYNQIIRAILSIFIFLVLTFLTVPILNLLSSNPESNESLEEEVIIAHVVHSSQMCCTCKLNLSSTL